MPKMKLCPVCQSDNLYQYKDDIQYSGVGEELLPKLGKGKLSVAKVRPAVCADCGDVRLIASSDARERMKGSEHWVRVEANSKHSDSNS